MTVQSPSKPRTKSINDLDVPPQHLESERALIGSLLLDNRVYDDICELVKPEHFYSDVHCSVYKIISALIDNGKPADAVTVAEKLDATGVLSEVGGVPFILQLLESVPHSGHAAHYAGIVVEKWSLRSLQGICQDSLRSIRADGDDVLEEHERALFALADQQKSSNQEMSIGDILVETIAAIDHRSKNPTAVAGVSSGFTDVDLMTNGFHKTTLTILAARPSMGKTAFVCNLADWFISSGVSTLMFSLEQSKLELAERFLAIRSKVDGHAIRKGNIAPADRHAILEASSELSQQGNMWIDDTASRSVAQIKAIARRIKRKHGLGIIIIDYLQLIEPEDKKATRENQVAAISRRLKALSKDLDVPVICLSQLNRGVETRDDKRPRLADLRESGAIEQDADIVMFLHRPDAYDPEDRPGLAEIIIAKHRSGPVGIVNLQWRKETMRFEDQKPADESNSQQF
jgi:replicative DNA helicase